MIAIVDDDEAVLRAMARLLRTAGMEAKTFMSGEEFIQLFEAVPSFAPDCVVLDIRMAGLSGLEVQDRLLKSGRQVPVVLMTGHDEPAARSRAFAAGAVGFLRKPFSSSLLFETLGIAMGREGRQGA